MRQLLLFLAGCLFWSCDSQQATVVRQTVPLEKISSVNHEAWVPGHTGELLSDITCDDPGRFSATGWTAGATDAERLSCFLAENLAAVSSIPGDRIERILMNRLAVGEASEKFPDPRLFVAFEAEDSLFLNQFLPVNIQDIGPGSKWSAEIVTEYPKDGTIRVRLNGQEAEEWTIAVRQPGWTNNSPDPEARYRWRTNRKLTIEVGGEYIFPTLVNGYAYITRLWKPGDDLIISFPMSVRRLIYQNQDGEERMSLEIGPVALGTKNDPEAQVALPDQGYLRESEDSSGVSVWDWTVNGVLYQFKRLPDFEDSTEVLIDWPYGS